MKDWLLWGKSSREEDLVYSFIQIGVNLRPREAGAGDGAKTTMKNTVYFTRESLRIWIINHREKSGFYRCWLLPPPQCVWGETEAGWCVDGSHVADAVKTTLWRETAIDRSSRRPYDIDNNSFTHTHTHDSIQHGIHLFSAMDPQLITLRWTDTSFLPWVCVRVCVYI